MFLLTCRTSKRKQRNEHQRLHKQSGADEQIVKHLFVQKHSQNAKKIA